MSSGERLQKVLARGGIASRRHAEELISAGRVRVNGKVVTELGTRVNPRRDRIEVDGKRVVAEPLVYYLFHKPRGTVTTLTDPEGRATIAEYLKDLPARVYPVGRLDFHTSGALLLTNDGDLAQALLHPRRAVPKTYVAKVRGVPSDAQLDPWRTGMDLVPVGDEPPGVRTRPADVEVLRHAPSGLDARSEEGTTWLKITLREGRNRQIHRMAEAVGLFVMRLARIAFAGITTEGLRPGELRPLTEKEVTMLRAAYLRPAEKAARAGAHEAVEPALEDFEPGEEAVEEASARGRGGPGARRRPAAERAPRGGHRGAVAERRGARGAGAGGARGGRGMAPAKKDGGGRASRFEERGSAATGPRREVRGEGARGPRREERGGMHRGPRREERGVAPRGPRGEAEPREPERGERDHAPRSDERRGGAREPERGGAWHGRRRG
jgi:23S rRNA pseudouridine2605 synthase